ncbi:MAG: M20/M25/M40 family metallo-hydrolase [Bryobacteraceae bacterium]
MKRVLLLGLCVAVYALGAGPAIDPTAELLRELIRVDTSNPPGRTAALAALLVSKFRPLGIETEIVATPSAGKVYFIARLKGDASKRPVLLAAHGDEVGVERKQWTVDPFAGVVQNGYVLGRGAIDFKGGLAVFAEAVLRLAHKKTPLARDVILLSEPDEEGAGPTGTPWIAANHWDKIDCEFALNEGGWIIERPNGKVRYVAISTADKTSLSLILTARGVSTHSSMPRPDNAIFALSRALAKLSAWEPPPRLLASTRRFFSTLAKTADPAEVRKYEAIAASRDEASLTRAVRAVAGDPLLHAFLGDTLAPVIVQGGFRANVIPSSAEANVNIRLLPGSSAEALRKQVERVIADPAIEVRLAGPHLNKPVPEPSPTNTDLFRALETAAKAVFPEAEVTPYLFQAGTDAYPWRLHGVPVYGIYPYPVDSEDLKRMHGNDERVKISSLAAGTEMIYRTLVAVAAKNGK